jgi:hypothetical protein
VSITTKTTGNGIRVLQIVDLAFVRPRSPGDDLPYWDAETIAPTFPIQ